MSNSGLETFIVWKMIFYVRDHSQNGEQYNAEDVLPASVRAGAAATAVGL